MQSSLDRLQSYGYPPELCEVVTQFSEYAISHFSELEPGVLLIGSTARGELSWAKEGERVRLFSDVEFLIAVSDKDKIKEHEFYKEINKLESRHKFGDLFHIDYTIIQWRKLYRLDTKFFIFESKKCGIDCGLRSVSAELPTVNRSNLNWKELNEVVLHRLNSVLHMVPQSLFDNTMTEKEKSEFSLGLAKNTLDITTWLHPYEGGELVAGFSPRLSTWSKEFLEKKKLGKYLSADDVEYMKSCLTLRKSPLENNVDPIAMLDKTILLYSKALSYCKAINSIEDKKDVSKMLISIKLFDEYRVRQRASQFLSLLSNAEKIGISKVIRNAVGVRRGVAVNICHYMLLALNDYTKSNEGSWKKLNQARDELSRLTNVASLQHYDFVNSWLNLRKEFKQYQDISHNY